MARWGKMNPSPLRHAASVGWLALTDRLFVAARACAECFVETWTAWRLSHRSAPDLPGPRHAHSPWTHFVWPGLLSTRRLPWGFQTPPLRRSRSQKVSPANVAADFGPVLPRTVHVPPTWSLTTSTGSSSRTAAGLLHPAPDHGVHRVSARAVTVVRLRLPACVVRSRASSPMLALQRLAPRVQPRRRHRRLLPPRR